MCVSNPQRKQYSATCARHYIVLSVFILILILESEGGRDTKIEIKKVCFMSASSPRQGNTVLPAQDNTVF